MEEFLLKKLDKSVARLFQIGKTERKYELCYVSNENEINIDFNIISSIMEEWTKILEFNSMLECVLYLISLKEGEKVLIEELTY